MSATCSVCNVVYETYFAEKSRFCSSACAQRGNFVRYKTLESVCMHCGVTFTANRHTKPECCSRKCGTQRRCALKTAAKPPVRELTADCAQCGAAFTMLETKPRITCTPSCKVKHWRAQKRLAAQSTP